MPTNPKIVLREGKVEALTRALADNRDIFEREAVRLQESQKEYLEERIKTHGRAQNRQDALLQALVSGNNRRVTNNGFVVGGGLAESSAGSYYRLIDQGTNIFVGRVLRGFFLTEGGRRVGPSAEDHRDPRLIQLHKQNPAAGNNRYGLRDAQGRFRTRKLKAGPGTNSAFAQTAGRAGKGAFVIRIGRPIRPYDYIEGGFQQWLAGGGKERIVQAIKSKIRRTVR